MKTEKKEWEKIWESGDYKAEIYDNCSKRVYKKEGLEKLKIEIDGTRWVGNTGGFHVYKYFIEDGDRLLNKIEEYDNDEASEEDVIELIDSLTCC